MTIVKIGSPSIIANEGPAPIKNPSIISPANFPNRMLIQQIGAKESFLVPYAPREVTYTGMSSTWTELPREGNRTPLLVPQQKNLDKLSFQLFFGHTDWDIDVTKQLDDFKKLAASKRPLIIKWSSWEGGHWRITNMTVSSTSRRAGTNEITRATVDVEFTRDSRQIRNIGPASGGKDDKGGSKNGKNGKGGGKGDKKARPLKYTVKKGDTLHSIAMKWYGNHKAWRKIAKHNKMKNPKKDLRVGMVLKLP